MGCSSSNRLTIEDIEAMTKLTSDRISYNTKHEQFDKYVIDILPDIIKTYDQYDKSTIIKMQELILSKKQITSIDQDIITTGLFDLSASLYITENNLITSKDIYEIANESIKVIHSSTTSSSLIKMLLDNMSRIFPKIQTSLSFTPKLVKEMMENKIINPIFQNLKFNVSHQIELLYLEFNSALLTNNNYYINNISEIIKSNINLKTIMIRFDETVMNDVNMNNLKPIINMIKQNDSIKLIVLEAAKEGILNLSSEFELGIEQMLNKDQLIGLVIRKFGLSDHFIKNFPKNISDIKNLRLLCLESKTSNINLLDELVIQGIGRNRSIQICLLAGFGISEPKVVEYKQVQMHNDVLKFFEYYKNLY